MVMLFHLIVFVVVFFPGPNAVSISLSPLNNFILIGLASRKLHWQITQHQVKFLLFYRKKKILFKEIFTRSFSNCLDFEGSLDKKPR